jgi:SOS regulatory protein LexA
MLVNKTRPKPLTSRQKQVLDYIKKYLSDFDCAPTLEEIASQFSLSIPTVHEHVEKIRSKGYLYKDNFQQRSISPLERQVGAVEVPLMGTIAAGIPIYAHEAEIEMVYFSTEMVSNPENHYALKVSGTSMQEKNILDNDVILIRYQDYADKGDIIVAAIDNEVTLKEFGGYENGKVKLLPHNSSMQPILADINKVEIRGKYAGLIRRT